MKKTTEPTPDPVSTIARVPWNPWLGVLFVVLVYVVSTYYTSPLLISIYPALHHWSLAYANNWLQNSVPAQFFYILFAEAVTLGCIYAFLRHYGVGFRILGLRRPRWSDLGYGLAMWVVYFIAYTIMLKVVSVSVPGFNANEQQQVGFNSVHGAAQLLLTYISLAILPPFTEEIMVRGFLYSSLKKALPTIVAIVVTSVMFASAHLGEGGSAGPLYVAALDTFLLSLALIFFCEKTGSLWSSITLHTVKNSLAFVALFFLSNR